ncbi:MAG TPA: hypothetical protein EYH06_09255 [Chromatiales bacterium]|nr:hypothetical protein [Thiotrichales bacterium]HIP68763.1 hypothetical protein [Chromatiales bacterium]
MNRLSKYLLIALVLLLSLPVQADRRGREYREHRDDDRDYSISREEAARIARERNGGRILDIKPRRDGYRVKTLRKGRVRVYDIDGHSGEVRD